MFRCSFTHFLQKRPFIMITPPHPHYSFTGAGDGCCCCLIFWLYESISKNIKQSDGKRKSDGAQRQNLFKAKKIHLCHERQHLSLRTWYHAAAHSTVSGDISGERSSVCNLSVMFVTSVPSSPSYQGHVFGFVPAC